MNSCPPDADEEILRRRCPEPPEQDALHADDDEQPDGEERSRHSSTAEHFRHRREEGHREQERGDRNDLRQHQVPDHCWRICSSRLEEVL